MMYWNGNMTAAGWVFSILATLIILALIIGVAVWIAQSLRDRDQRPGETKPGASAREILDRRLASGELTVEQYQQLRGTLEVNGHSTTTPARPEEHETAGAAR